MPQHRTRPAEPDLRAVLAMAVIVATAGAAAPAAAQAVDDKYWIEASAYFPGINTNATVSRPGMPGTDIDLEKDLGLDKHETLPAIYAGWRFSKRFSVTGEYYGLDRNSSRTLTRDITFDGVTFPLSATVDGKFRSDVYRLTLGYAFYQSENAEFGAGIGLHATNFEVGLHRVNPAGPAAGVTLTQREDFLAPLPTVGVYGTYQFTPKWILNGRVDYLSLTLGDYSGSILNAQAALGYRFNQTFQAGIDYRYVEYNLDVNRNRYTASIDYKFSGPSIFLRASFH
jgi:Outer membrane protein beta-barrel domain